MTEQDLLTNARELLRLASSAIDRGQISEAKGFTVFAARYLDPPPSSWRASLSASVASAVRSRLRLPV